MACIPIKMTASAKTILRLNVLDEAKIIASLFDPLRNGSGSEHAMRQDEGVVRIVGPQTVLTDNFCQRRHQRFPSDAIIRVGR